ncbi:hypothetical protein EYF80_014605 [Liparis tanakae]|uniref:Uncharacterized protein n=1 Tax=Liparis tanakae TaxID=230148 RepID=A0A4Z2ICI3_9TELE|nr:hypothetical protein EYF80_014605 [Liparis tanakae]
MKPTTVALTVHIREAERRPWGKPEEGQDPGWDGFRLRPALRGGRGHQEIEAIQGLTTAPVPITYKLTSTPH